MEASHSPLASVLKGASKKAFSCLSLPNVLGTLAPSRLCVVGQQVNGLFASPMERGEGKGSFLDHSWIIFAYVPSP